MNGASHARDASHFLFLHTSYVKRLSIFSLHFLISHQQCTVSALVIAIKYLYSATLIIGAPTLQGRPSPFKPMMHTENSPYYHKISKCSPYSYKIYKFPQYL